VFRSVKSIGCSAAMAIASLVSSATVAHAEFTMIDGWAIANRSAGCAKRPAKRPPEGKSPRQVHPRRRQAALEVKSQHKN
jgi:hypothetical protein